MDTISLKYGLPACLPACLPLYYLPLTLTQRLFLVLVVVVYYTYRTFASKGCTPSSSRLHIVKLARRLLSSGEGPIQRRMFVYGTSGT